MSGIGGILNRSGKPIDPEIPVRMANTITHRGPDRTNVWREGKCALFHCMLQTTEESVHESLPYKDPLTGNVITADARIDNRAELANKLGLSPSESQKMADSAYILAAYNRWGEDCAEKLIGDFAFAIWDEKKKQFFCARDHMGVKPFYYHCSENLFIFGSEIKAILASKEVSREIDEQRVLDYLVFYNSDTQSTFFQNIKRLPARFSFTVSADTFRLNQYWDFSPEKEIHYNSDKQYAEHFLELFTGAVEARLRSDYPVGAFLSGGLDSSSISCVAAQLLRERNAGRLLTFSEIFKGLPPEQAKKADERCYMDAAIEKCGSDPVFITFNQHGPLRVFDKVKYDEPMPYYNGYLLDETCREATTRNVRVLLDGTDGDTTVSHGYERLYHLGTHFRILKLLKQVKALSRTNIHPYSAKKIVWKYAIRPTVPEGLVGFYKSVRMKKGEYSLLASNLLDPFRLTGTDWEKRARELGLIEHHFRKGRSPQYDEFTSPFQQYVMEYIDSRAGCYPQEIRYPFWDRRLMEFCLALPLDQKLNNGWTRVVLRKAMSSILPQEIVSRPGKADLSPQFLKDFIKTAPPYIEELLSPTSRAGEWINKKNIRSAWNSLVKQPYKSHNEAMQLYAGFTLEIWLKSLEQ